MSRPAYEDTNQETTSTVITRALPTTLLAAFATLGLGSCAGLFTKDTQGPGLVDDFLVRIERVHVETELSREGVRDALDLLLELADPQTQSDPVQAFERFEAAIDEAEDRQDDLQKAVKTMRKQADPFFDGWATDLMAFTNTEMRLRSQERLLGTKQRYEAIEASLEPVETSYEACLSLLRDVSLFLENDLNASSVAAIETEIRYLTSQAAELDADLQSCLSACRDYVENAALPVTVDDARSDD